MKKLLLTFALVGVISAGAAFRACAYCALAYNPATGKIGWIPNCNTLQEARTKALQPCDGRIEFADGTKGFYAVDYWMDRNSRIGVSWVRSNTLNEARRIADKWCLDRGYTISKRSASWQETVGSPSPAAYGVPAHQFAHVVIENRTRRTVRYTFTWGSATKDVGLKAGGHEDHWYKYNPDGVPRPDGTFHLAEGEQDDYFGLLFGFDDKPKRYIIQADPTREPGLEYVADEFGRRDGFSLSAQGKG